MFPRFLPRLAMGIAMLTPAGAALAQTGSSDGHIEHCDRDFGTLAVSEPQAQMLAALSQYRLESPATMLRMIVQESGCFTVVERGAALQSIQQERALASGGMLQQDSNLGGGQLQAADFVMTPAIQFSADTGGIGGAVGGLLGRLGGVGAYLGGLAGGVKFKEAETTLLLSDVRSGIQVASQEGQASKMDFSLGGWGWTGLGWASAGGYSKSPEGKLIAASLLDNYNRIVLSIRDRRQLIQSTSTTSRANAAASIQATTAHPHADAGAPPPGSAPGYPPAASAAAMPAPIQNSAGNLPAGMLGNYSGTYGGADEGTFNVVVASNGMVQGTGYSNKSRVGFIASGLVSASGQMQLSGSGQAGSSTFAGMIDLRTGTVRGQWFIVAADRQPQLGGSFSGQHQ